MVFPLAAGTWGLGSVTEVEQVLCDPKVRHSSPFCLLSQAPSTSSFCVWVTQDVGWLNIPCGSLSYGISDSATGFRDIFILPAWVWEDTPCSACPASRDEVMSTVTA